MDKNIVYKSITEYVYFFHMPLFVFLSGYLVKRSKSNNVGRCLQDILMPYIIFQFLYFVMGGIAIKLGVIEQNNTFVFSLLCASGPLYYLVCLFIWRNIIEGVMKLKFPVLIMFSIGIIIPLDNNPSIMMMPLLALFPFFVLGCKFKDYHLEKIRHIPKIISVVIMIITMIGSIYLPYEIILFRYNYAELGLSPIMGMIYKSIYYVIALSMIMAMINLVPAKISWITGIGKNSMTGYITSSFSVPYAYILLYAIFPILKNDLINILVLLIFCILVNYVSTRNICVTIYNYIMSKLNSFIFKDYEVKLRK